MANSGVICTVGQKIMLNRSYDSGASETVPSRFKVGTGTTTVTAGDTDVETVEAINGGNFKNFVTGYPTLDEANMEATIRCYLDSTEANANLTEIGPFNTDGTEKMLSHDVFTVISKSTDDEIAFVIKNRIY